MLNLFNHTQRGQNRLHINTIRVSIESCLAHRNERESRKVQKKTFKFAFARSDTWHNFHLQCLVLIGLKKGNTRSISLFSLDQITALGVPCHSGTGSIWRKELTSQEVFRFKENMKRHSSLHLLGIIYSRVFFLAFKNYITDRFVQSRDEA